MMATVPSVGTNAAHPGKGVSVVNIAVANTTAATPPMPSGPARRRGATPVTSAKRPPRPNCHARLGEARYASGSLSWVQ